MTNNSQADQVKLNECFFDEVNHFNEKRALRLFTKGLIPLTKHLTRALEINMFSIVKKIHSLVEFHDEDETYRLLNAAVRTGQIDIVKKVLKVINPLNWQHEGGLTALMVAAQTDDLDCFKLIYAFGGIDKRDCYGQTLISFAAFGRTSTVLDFLMSPDQRLECQIPDLQEQLSLALIGASNRCRMTNVQKLLDYGADLSYRDLKPVNPIVPRTALEAALDAQNDDMIDFIVSLHSAEQLEKATQEMQGFLDAQPDVYALLMVSIAKREQKALNHMIPAAKSSQKKQAL